MLGFGKAVKENHFLAGCIAIASIGLSTPAAQAVTLTNATATFSQNNFSVGEASDGSEDSANGWAIDPNEVDQTAVWETQADLNASILEFSLVQNFTVQHLLGRFRLSVTSDARTNFADGLASGGDVTANWSVLINPMVSGPAGLTFETLGDNSVLVGGTIPTTATYLVQYSGIFSGISGVRLEAIEDISLPFNGPGLQPNNGNFVLSEITLTTTIPEPSTLALFATGLALLAFMGWRRRRPVQVRAA